MPGINTKITVLDNPRVLRTFLSSLPKSVNQTTDVEDGNIIPEVDYVTTETKLICLKQPFVAYRLRKARKNRIPQHVFGKLHIGQAFSALIPVKFNVPVVGGSVILQPVVTPEQAALASLCRFINADAYWFINIPSPIGTALVMKVMAPEFDDETETRGIRWKPQAVNVMAVHVPWNSDVNVVPIGSGREGQSGLAIKIQTVENNSSETVQETLTGIAWCVVTNVITTSFVNGGREPASIKGLNYIPVTKPPPAPVETETSTYFRVDEHMDRSTIEVQAEGVNSLVENMAVDDTPTRVLEPTSEKPLPPPKPPRKGTKGVGKKDQTGMLNTYWFPMKSVTLSDDNLGKTVTYSIDPNLLTAEGESMSLPMKRNFWCSGSNKAGYVRTLVVKCVLARSPNISGSVELVDSGNMSARYILEHGGNIEFPVMPTLFASPRNGVFRDANNAWMRTDQMVCNFTYTNLLINRNENTNDISMSVMVKIGDTIFQSPTRPKKIVRPKRMKEFLYITKCLADEEARSEEVLENKAKVTYHADLSGLTKEALYNFDRGNYYNQVTGEYQHELPMTREEIEGPEWSSEYSYDQQGNISDRCMALWRATIAPPAGGALESGETDVGGAYEEQLDQDDYWVKAYSGEIEVGKTVAIPLNLSVIEDVAGDGETNVIAQKFERYAHIVPLNAGQFGPKIANYTCQIRLPTDMTATVEHVSLPGDMNAEAAIYVFGLSSILSMATSALTSIGGPMLSGIINTGRELLGGLGGILGGKPPEEKQSDPSATPSAIAGGIDLSRFINFLKPVLANEATEPTMGSLLLNILNLFSGGAAVREATKLPIEVFIQMDKCAVERTVVNRAVTPVNSGMQNRVYLPMDSYVRIIEAFFAHDKTFEAGTYQNQCFVQFMSTVFSSDFKTVTKPYVHLDEILNKPVQKGDYTQMMNVIIEASREDQ